MTVQCLLFTVRCVLYSGCSTAINQPQPQVKAVVYSALGCVQCTVHICTIQYNKVTCTDLYSTLCTFVQYNILICTFHCAGDCSTQHFPF